MIKSFLFAFATLFTVASFAQKSNISDAILRYRKYNLMGASYEDNLKNLTEAKSFIDLASINSCLVYTSDAADELTSVHVGCCRVSKKSHKSTENIPVEVV